MQLHITYQNGQRQQESFGCKHRHARIKTLPGRHIERSGIDELPQARRKCIDWKADHILVAALDAFHKLHCWTLQVHFKCLKAASLLLESNDTRARVEGTSC